MTQIALKYLNISDISGYIYLTIFFMIGRINWPHNEANGQ